MTSASPIPTRSESRRALRPAPTVQEWFSARSAAALIGMSKRWVELRLKEYRVTGGKRGLGPVYSPTPRKSLVKRTDIFNFMAKFRT